MGFDFEENDYNELTLSTYIFNELGQSTEAYQQFICDSIEEIKVLFLTSHAKCNTPASDRVTCKHDEQAVQNMRDKYPQLEESVITVMLALTGQEVMVDLKQVFTPEQIEKVQFNALVSRAKLNADLAKN